MQPLELLAQCIGNTSWILLTELVSVLVGDSCWMAVAHVCLASYLYKPLGHQTILPSPTSDVFLSFATSWCIVNYWELDVGLEKILMGLFGGFSSWCFASPPLPHPEFPTLGSKSCIALRSLTVQHWRSQWVPWSLDPFTRATWGHFSQSPSPPWVGYLPTIRSVHHKSTRPTALNQLFPRLLA